MEQKTEIIVCPTCRGIGMVYERNTDGSVRQSFGKPVTQICSTCAGEHVVIRRTTVEYFQLSPSVVEEEKKKDWWKLWQK